VVNLLVVSVALATLWLVPAWALPLTLGLAGPLIIAPGVLGRAARQRLEADDPEGALRLARLAATLHPAPATREAVIVYGAAAEVQRAGSAAPYERLALSGSERVAAWARLAVEIHDGRWADLLARHHRGELAPFVTPGLRALARLGRPDELIALARASEATREPTERAQVDLIVLTETGRVDTVEAMLAGPFAHLHRDARDLTRARVRLVADPDDTAARAELVRLGHAAVPLRVRQSATALASDPVAPLDLDPADRAWVDSVAQRVRADARLGPLPLRQAWLTLGLMLGILVMFAMQLATGAIDAIRPLLRLGALWTPYVHTGEEYWRLVAAMFLHGGWLHVGLNVVVLAEIGRHLERLVPRWVYLLVYLGTGTGSFALITWLAARGEIDETLVVGASGAIFGLIGASALVLLVLYRGPPTSLAGRRLGSIGILLAAQFVFDLLVPQSSMLGHLGGFGLGVLLAALLVPFLRGWSRRSLPGAPGSPG
jgi:rhomboid protease GluP